jgi:hypothetical protein
MTIWPKPATNKPVPNDPENAGLMTGIFFVPEPDALVKQAFVA